MAPEQLEGQEADARSDLFAFGAVLYEMLTGRKAFEGTSQATVIAAILTAQPPPPSTIQTLAPRGSIGSCRSASPKIPMRAGRALVISPTN